MPKNINRLSPAPGGRDGLLAALLAAALALAGCKAAVSVSGSFATPRETVTGTVQTGTNGVTVGGSYQAGTTNVGGAIIVGK